MTDQAQRAKNWLFGGLDLRNTAFQEDRAKYCQEVEELRRICAEADRAGQLKLDEIPVKQKENPSTVDQLMAQMQDLQDKVNSVNDVRGFFDLETASQPGSWRVLQYQLLDLPGIMRPGNLYIELEELILELV